MKKPLSILLLFCSFSTIAFAQGNLQFNQAKYIELSFTPSGSNYPTTQQTITVPAGKVWKIESASASEKLLYSGSTYFHSPFNAALILNDKIIYDAFSSGSSSNLAAFNLFPIWLPAGTYTLVLEAECISCSGATYYGFISGIEFNITQ